MKLTTDDCGDFTANGLQAGSYKAPISRSGFKQFEQSEIALTAGERLLRFAKDINSLGRSLRRFPQPELLADLPFFIPSASASMFP